VQLHICGLVLTHHPGMTASGLLRCARNDSLKSHATIGLD
jgi:hypothetical protein